MVITKSHLHLLISFLVVLIYFYFCPEQHPMAASSMNYTQCEISAALADLHLCQLRSGGALQFLTLWEAMAGCNVLHLLHSDH